MLFWIILAGLTGAVLLIVMYPLLQKPGDSEPVAAAADIAVYRDQLTEIESDLERGLIGDSEAKAARTEVSRRLLQQTDKIPAAAASTSDGASTSRVAFLGSAIGVPLVALGLYLYAGSPNLPGLPYAERMAAKGPITSIDILVAKAETQLRQNPKDGMGWDALAPIYLRKQQYQKAAEAYARALDILGETPKRLSGLAISRISVDNGIVSEETRLIFNRLLQMQPGRADVLFWLAKAKEQDGKLQAAAEDYRGLLKTAPAEAPWRAMVASHLARLQSRLGGGQEVPAGPVAANRDRGPTAGDIAAASKMTAGDRAQMINNMVAGLAERLKSKGDDLPGWQKLVRAYAVLGKSAEARKALVDARAQFAGNGEALAALDQLAKRFNLGT